MKLRLLALSFLFGVVGTGLSWLTAQPALVLLMRALTRLPAELGGQAAVGQVVGLLPWALSVDAIVLTGLSYVLLDATVGRPLAATQATLEQLERLDLELPLVSSGGPLLSRFQASLRRAAQALQVEQALNRSQLSQLQAQNARIATAQMELVAAERLATVGRLAAGVAHEVGNPLGGILGYVSLARSQSEGNEELRGYLDLIDQEVRRIDGIVRGLLELGRPGAREAAPAGLRKLTETCVKLLRGGPELRGVEISVEVDESIVVQVDSAGLTQVLLNLLLNAAQAMNGAGKVRLSSAAAPGFAELVVEDSGPGIPTELLGRIFEPFFTTKSAGKGTGLGLSVSQHLLTGMGGALKAENRAEGGARFRLVLPVA